MQDLGEGGSAARCFALKTVDRAARIILRAASAEQKLVNDSTCILSSGVGGAWLQVWLQVLQAVALPEEAERRKTAFGSSLVAFRSRSALA